MRDDCRCLAVDEDGLRVAVLVADRYVDRATQDVEGTAAVTVAASVKQQKADEQTTKHDSTSSCRWLHFQLIR